MAAEVSSLGRMARGYKEDGGAEGKQDLVTRDLFRADGGRGAGAGVGGGAAVVLDSPENGSNRHLQDLNLPPLPAAAASAGSGPLVYQSACTLEKVKSALERESRLGAANAPASPSTSCSATINSSSSSSFKRRSPGPAASADDEWDAAMMVVAGCPVCLMYVLVSTAEPACPRCGADATLSESSRRRHQKTKRPRIDLNFSVQPADE